MKKTAMLAIIALCCATSANAGLVTGFGGNTQPSISTSAGLTQGFINFAVFDRSNGTATDSFDTGLANANALLTAAGFNTSSSFLYVFQNVNIGTDIASGSVNVIASRVTGDGVLLNVAYSQVTSSQSFLGGSAAAPGNISGAVTNATQAEATAATESGLINPTLLTLNATSLVATYSPAISGLGARSSIWGYTSNFAPAFTLGSIQDSGVAANGTVPGNLATSVPEPSTVQIGLIGLIPLAILTLTTRRRTDRG